MSKEYTLRTIKDIFDNVPADRIEECMKELTTLIVSAKHMAETLRLAATDIAVHDGVLSKGAEFPAMYAFPEEIVWKDDGEGVLAANFPGGKESESTSGLRMEIRRKATAGAQEDSTSTDERAPAPSP